MLNRILSMVTGSASETLPEQASLIDVRSPEEFAAGHIEGAIPLPLPSVSQGITNVAPDKATPIIVYCQSGARSAAARNQLLGLGYQHVINGGGLHSLASSMHRRIVR